MMLKRLLSLGAAALAAVTTACGDGPATVTGTWRSPATWSSMVYATTTGPMLVEVHGDPFGLATGQFRAFVAETMTNKVFGRNTAFTADPQSAPRPQFRVVLAFNPPPDADPRHLCAGRVATALPVEGSDRITVQGVFCQDAEMLASIQGWVARVESPSDKRFTMLLSQLTRELFGNP